jgi:hypothetical protein
MTFMPLCIICGADPSVRLWGGPLVRGRPPGRPFGICKLLIRSGRERDEASRADHKVRPTIYA